MMGSHCKQTGYSGFVEPDYKPPTATRVEKMHEESAAELRGGLQRVDLVTVTTV